MQHDSRHTTRHSPVRRCLTAATAALFLVVAAIADEPEVSAEEAVALQDAHGLVESGNVAAAITRLQAVATPQASPIIFDTLGVFLQQANRLPEAAAAFRGALTRDPNCHRARLNLLKVLLQQDDFDKASPLVDAILEHDPNRHWVRMTRVRLLLRNEKWDDAVPDLLDLLDSGLAPSLKPNLPGKGELWKLLGYARLQQGHAGAAETAFRNAIAHLPEDDELRVQLVQSVLRHRGIAAAAPLVRLELQRTPLNADYWRLLAGADYDAGNPQKALLRLECVRRLGIAGQKDLADLGDLLLDQGLVDEAIARYESAAALDSPPVSRLLRAAEGLLSMGRPDAADKVLAAAMKAKDALGRDEQRRARLLQARITESRGDEKRALAIFAELLRENPLDGDLLMHLGRLQQQHGNLEAALAYFERAGRAVPKQRATALVRQAEIAVERGDYTKAVDLLQKSLGVKHQPYVARYLKQVQRLLE